MYLHEDAVNTGGNRSPGQGFHKSRCPPDDSPSPRQLHAMGGIKHHRIAVGAHNREGTLSTTRLL